MKLVLISDTHTHHRELKIPKCDVLIHSGDMTYTGGMDNYKDLGKWFKEVPAKHVVVIPGNHDLGDVNEMMHHIQSEKVYFLLNSAVVIDGVKFYGSPYTPTFGEGWAFNANPKWIRGYWDKIPMDTDVLVTHGPAFDILDKNAQGWKCGCRELLTAVRRVRPLVHAFGHIHESRGVLESGGTTSINASSLDGTYSILYKPIEFEL